MTLNTRLPWVVFILDENRYAISCDYAREMVTFKNFTRVPMAPNYVRGLINLRGRVIALIDLRKWTGMPPPFDLIAEMHQREKEHQEWLDALEVSVRDNRPFTKATDPHQCAFGKWYDSYRTTDIGIRALLREFDAPHKAIHGVAAQALEAAGAGDLGKAHGIIERTRETTLQEMKSLFARFREALKDLLFEVAMVLEKGDRSCAVVVDNIESVEMLKNHFDTLDLGTKDNEPPPIPWIGRRQKDDRPVLIPNVELLFSQVFGGGRLSAETAAEEAETGKTTALGEAS